MIFWKKSVRSTVSFVLFSPTNELMRVAIAQYNRNFSGDKLTVFHMQAGILRQLAITWRYAFKYHTLEMFLILALTMCVVPLGKWTRCVCTLVGTHMIVLPISSWVSSSSLDSSISIWHFNAFIKDTLSRDTCCTTSLTADLTIASNSAGDNYTSALFLGIAFLFSSK